MLSVREYRDGVMKHKMEVAAFLLLCAREFARRAVVHDMSKFDKEEEELYRQVIPKLQAIEYGSRQYKAVVGELGPALTHHYQQNSHHPEHYEQGVNQMDLFDVFEMVCDWMAAAQSAPNGNILSSFEINKDRYGIGQQFYGILWNTVLQLSAPENRV